MLSDTMGIISRQFPNPQREMLIPILQEIQQHEGYLSKEALLRVGTLLNVPASKVFGVASFYNQFRFKPIGKYLIQVCRGTACHVKGSLKLLDVLKEVLQIDDGETTRDKMFTLEVVSCIGACGLAPVICVNGEYYAKITPENITAIIRDLRNNHDSQ